MGGLRWKASCPELTSSLSDALDALVFSQIIPESLPFRRTWKTPMSCVFLTFLQILAAGLWIVLGWVLIDMPKKTLPWLLIVQGRDISKIEDLRSARFVATVSNSLSHYSTNGWARKLSSFESCGSAQRSSTWSKNTPPKATRLLSATRKKT